MEPLQNETNRTLEVGDRIKTVPASDQLVHRLRQIPSVVREGYERVPKRVIWAVAAGIALLIAVNIISARNYSETKTANVESASYFDYLKTI